MTTTKTYQLTLNETKTDLCGGIGIDSIRANNVMLKDAIEDLETRIEAIEESKTRIEAVEDLETRIARLEQFVGQ